MLSIRIKLSIILRKAGSAPQANNMATRTARHILLLLFLSSLAGCISPYVPETDEKEELLVVEGIITNQQGINTIKLSRSIPLWKNQGAEPLNGCNVWLSDDLGQIYSLKGTAYGTYITDSATFRGETGRKYTLHITINTSSGIRNYESFPVEMKPVPPIDTIYYEKEAHVYQQLDVEGCNIYLDTHDPSGNCKFYRWNYSETWEIRLEHDAPNKICWRSENCEGIFIKNASLLAENTITRHPVISITDPIDRLTVKYSILVNQYSINEDEYVYWDRLKNTLDQVGGLYDLIPAYIPNNIYCIENPNEKVLGYFSVSAVSSRRLFIKDKFNGHDESCNSEIKFGLPKFDWSDPRSPTYGMDTSIVGLNATVWVAEDHTDEIPPFRVLVHTRWCSDCTKKGIIGEYINIKPSFWDED